MNDLIVGKHKNIFFGISIRHGECHLIVVVLAEIWIQLHILKEIMHPTHIPLHRKSKTVILCLACHLRPCCGLLCNHHQPRITAYYQAVQVLEKLNRLEILIPAIFVWYPLTILAAIIQIQHRSYRIYTQTIHMELLNPVNCISDQEILYLILAVIKYLGAPVRMLTLARIRILKQAAAVKCRQTLLVPREMRRYPIKNDTDLVFMQIVYKISKILRRAIAGCRCIIAGHLITPGTVKRMLRNAHQLDMCVPHVLHVLRQFRCQLAVIVVARLVIPMRMLFPAARMYLVNRYRTFILHKFLPRRHPCRIRPFDFGNIRDL